MRQLLRIRWLVCGAALLSLGSCATSQQWMDFGRTELARTVADILGQLFQQTIQGST
jgi:hypothetical protein